MGQTRFRLFRPEDMGEDLWDAFTALRNARACYDDPFFDPVFAQLVAGVRSDLRVGAAFRGGEPIGFWPFHRRPGAWTRPVGGPFSDWHGPVLAQDANLPAHAFLKGLGLLGMSAYGWLPQDRASEDRLRLSGAHMTLLPKLLKLLEENDASDIPVVIGGIIPDEDTLALEELGVAGIFRPGTPTSEIVEFVRELAGKRE